MSAFARKLGPPAETATPQAEAGAGTSASLVALTRYGLERQARGDFQAAVEAFRAVADAAPRQPMVWNNLALALGGLGDHEQAVEFLRRSLHLDPTQTAIWVSLAAAALQSQRFEEAEAACDAAILREADNGGAWQIRAMVRAGRDDFAGAAEAFARTLAIIGEDGPLRANLGVSLFKCGRFHEAERDLETAAALCPDDADIAQMARLSKFVVAALEDDMARAAALCGKPAAAADTLFKAALLCLDWAGEPQAAGRVAKAWVAQRPDNLEARHLADAALGRKVARQPAALVAQHFDGLAEDFEAKLVGRLGYQGPDRLQALIASRIPADGALEVLDAGCGTGLCGPVLRPYARTLAGVDLSPGMLAKAQARGLYDALELADLTDMLRQTPGHWDLIAAADALPYLGALDEVFEAAAGALRPGGWFVFSTEGGDGGSFSLRLNGRYTHARGYISGLAAGLFEIVDQSSGVLRQEAGAPVRGDYFLLRRNPLPADHGMGQLRG